MSLRGVERRSNLRKAEIASLALAITSEVRVGQRENPIPVKPPYIDTTTLQHNNARAYVRLSPFRLQNPWRIWHNHGRAGCGGGDDGTKMGRTEWRWVDTNGFLP